MARSSTKPTATRGRGTSRPPSPHRPWRDRLDALFQPVDLASLVFFRVAFGAILLWEVWRYFHHGWIQSLYVAPPFHFTYYGFDWVRPWPGVGMSVHFLALGFLAACVMLGLRYRLAMPLTCLGWTYVFLLEKTAYLNHLYLVCLISFLMSFVPAHRAFSLDSLRDPHRRSDWAPAWALWLLRGQLAIPYIYGGLAKLNGDWLYGQPLEMWMSRMDHVRAVVPFYGEQWLAVAFSWMGLLLDLCVVPLLLWRRTRYWAFGAAVAFHLLNVVMFYIGIFPWLMICATTLFLAPDWPRKLFRLHAGREDKASAEPQQPVSAGGRKRLGGSLALPAADAVSRHRRVVVGLMAVWFAVQMLVPFRHLLYPGDVDWTEEGSRFAWRMMLCDKATALGFVVRNPQTGRASPVDLRPWLTEKQLTKMSESPEMLLQFSHFLNRELERAGSPNMEIRAQVLCSLNGRQAQFLIDPRVDLSRQERSLAHKPWIVPLVEPLPEDPWLVPQREWPRLIDMSRIPRRGK